MEPEPLLDWRDLLAFERDANLLRTPKAQAVRTEFGISLMRYYQILERVIERPAAMLAEPVLVGRLLEPLRTREE